MHDISFEPNSVDIAILNKGLSEEAYRVKGLSEIEPYAYFIRDEKGKVMGGISGFSYYGCQYIDALWITETLRGKGFGKALLEKTEQLGKERNCSFMSVNTMDWEALPFYQKFGYEVEYVRHGYHKDSSLYFLRKPLV